ncbi:MAG: (Fe-S)-binding protein, partial [bacterium]
KAFRAREQTDRRERAALRAARHWAGVERGARAALRAADAASRALGDRPLRGAAQALRRVAGAELVPIWPSNMPPPAPARLPATPRDGAAAAYLPACINRIFGNPRGAPPRPSLPEALVAVSARAGLGLWIPADAAGNCCATPWSSKGHRRGHELMARRVADSLWRWSEGGTLPVVIDASSCALGLAEDVTPLLDDPQRERYEQVEVIDSIAWAHDRLLPALEVERRVGPVALHPTCSTVQMGLGPQLQAIASAIADEVVIPAGTGCCGFAGDRGLLHPELPASALRDVAAELEGLELDACLCSNRTCEIGLQQATGRPYASFVFLLEELTRPV